jgi:hypothetical protein
MPDSILPSPLEGEGPGVRGRLFWLFWGAKKGRLFWGPPKKSPPASQPRRNKVRSASGFTSAQGGMANADEATFLGRTPKNSVPLHSPSFLKLRLGTPVSRSSLRLRVSPAGMSASRLPACGTNGFSKSSRGRNQSNQRWPLDRGEVQRESPAATKRGRSVKSRAGFAATRLVRFERGRMTCLPPAF